jgi:hypothetical protein
MSTQATLATLATLHIRMLALAKECETILNSGVLSVIEAASVKTYEKKARDAAHELHAHTHMWVPCCTPNGIPAARLMRIEPDGSYSHNPTGLHTFATFDEAHTEARRLKAKGLI